VTALPGVHRRDGATFGVDDIDIINAFPAQRNSTTAATAMTATAAIMAGTVRRRAP
jgi:hypothetical protein